MGPRKYIVALILLYASLITLFLIFATSAESNSVRIRNLFIFLSVDGRLSSTAIKTSDSATKKPKKVLKPPAVVLLGGDTERGQTDQRAISKSYNAAGETCRIPQLEVNGSEVIKFYSKQAPLQCNKKGEDWAVVDKDGKFNINPAMSKKHGTINCSIAYFYRVDEDKVNSDAFSAIGNGDRINRSDFSEVRCCATDNSTWTNYFILVVPNETRIQSLSKVKRGPDWSGLSVYMIGFDSLSQMAFRRQLPRTVRYLEDELGAIVLNGYNIVGDGTPQAFIPILTAKTELELPLTRKRYKSAKYVDEAYPFIWKNFSDAGYITSYSEDTAKLGIYTYRLKGFKKQPTDHYGRTFFQLVEPRLKARMNLKCLGASPMHKEFFRYAGETLTRYNKSVPKFVLAFHGSLSHDNINAVQVADADTVANLKGLKECGALDNAVVIVMADHGRRFAKLRETHQGQLEERLPFFAIALPRKFRESKQGESAYKNLLLNKDRLTSPFDIHATFLDIIHWPSEKDLKKPSNLSQRSISLFRVIPESRTCASAGIETHWCTCLNWESAMDSGEQKSISEMLAETLVNAFNTHTEPERKLCAPLKLAKLEESRRLLPHADLLKYKTNSDKDGFVPKLTGNTQAVFAHYQLKFRTSPGDALYEATVVYNWKTNQVTVDMTAVSHVNKYGDMPHCVIDKNYFLAAYCVCYDKVK